MIKIFDTIKKFIKKVIDDDVPALAAFMSYHMLMAFFPFLILVGMVASLLGVTALKVLSLAGKTLPPGLNEMLAQNSQIFEIGRDAVGITALIVTTVFIASQAITAVRKGLNKAYGVAETRRLVVQVCMDVAMTVVVCVVIFCTLVVLVFGGKIIALLGYHGGAPNVMLILRAAVMLLMLVATLAVVYYFVPNKRIRWRHVAIGALSSAAAWVVVSLSFAAYVEHFGNYAKLYGTIGGVVVMMLWLYISAQIIIIGGELNAFLHEKAGDD